MKLPVMAAEHLSQLQAFEAKILCNHAKIEAWFRSQWNEHRPPFYGSVDIRNAGYKISSIDMNLFPGGFNNLNPTLSRWRRLPRRMRYSVPVKQPNPY